MPYLQLKICLIATFSLALGIAMVPRASANDADGNKVPAAERIQRPISAEMAAEMQNEAVEMARSGEYQPAIDILERLLQSDYSNSRVSNDLLIIFGWAERDLEALQLAEGLDLASAPVGVLETLAKSARNVREFEQSVHWYEQAISVSPNRLDSHLGLAFAYADMGRPAQALNVLQSVPDGGNYATRVSMASAYVHRSNADYAPEIASYDEILARDPNHRDALRGKIFAVQRLLLPEQALAIASAHPEILTRDEIGQIRTDWAAVKVRWANQTATDKSLEDYPIDEVFADISAASEQFADNEAVQRRTSFDRIVALRSRQRMVEAVVEYELIASTTENIPAYVLGAAGGAYLSLRQPKKAEELLSKALQQDPNNFRLNQDLFYVYVDLEQHRRAQELAEKLRLGQPVWRQMPGSRVIKSNPQRMSAEITAGLSFAFADQLPESQARFEDLLSRAPHNTDVRLELASVFRQRGWTDRALFEYQQILAVEPDLIGADVGHAHALLDRRQYQDAEQKITALISDAPMRQDVKRLEHRWQRHNKNQYSIDSSFGESSGSQFGNQQNNIEGFFRAKPFAYRWRPFLHTTDAFAEFPEGDASRRRLGAGIEYRGIDWTGTVELDGERNGGGELGVSGELEWLVSDAVSWVAVFETQSDAIPLRGYRVGVDASRALLLMRYRASESRQLSLSGELMDFSDGNTRNNLFLRGRQRVVTLPTYKLNLDAEVFTSRNSKQNVAYYSPSRDLSLMVTANNIWRTFRRYDAIFTQQLNAAFGVYQQQSFDSGPIGYLQYLADFDINEALTLRFGVRRSRNIYDGVSEYGTFFTLGIGGSF